MQLCYLERTRGIVNFGMTTLNKFHILQAKEYVRVLFLCNMGDVFEEPYKEEGLFEDNVVKEGSVAPMTASMFLLRRDGYGCTNSAAQMRRSAWDSFKTHNMCMCQMENLQMKVCNDSTTTMQN